jgi:hypothetical protein
MDIFLWPDTKDSIGPLARKQKLSRRQNRLRLNFFVKFSPKNLVAMKIMLIFAVNNWNFNELIQPNIKIRGHLRHLKIITYTHGAIRRFLPKSGQGSGDIATF